ncbi:probable Ufm1-specific protease isoform X1 [Cryptomeria japonica]|uniref:probable Ufm1-specific protease isoform X1 n=1 Tax=Cryptomeria japonica TaxID=3369 RepID=UPI0025AC7EAD|nr:probable Ufm1-specific protease isoform X1 [Cryptomeria japonica]
MEKNVLRILCSDLIKARKEPGLQWLIGVPFMPFTIISCFKCIHTAGNPFAPNYTAEAEDLQVLLPRGLEIIGALYVSDTKSRENALKAADSFSELKRYLLSVQNESSFVTGSTTSNIDGIDYFICTKGKSLLIENFESVIHEEKPAQYLWDAACLLCCQMSLSLPVYFSSNKSSEEQFSLLVEDFAANLKGPRAVFQAEKVVSQSEGCSSVLLQCMELNDSASQKNIDSLKRSIGNQNACFLPCSTLCSTDKHVLSASGVEFPEPIKITVFYQSSHNLKAFAPRVDYIPVKEDVRVITVKVKLDIACVASRELSLSDAVSKLIIPGLIEQLKAMWKAADTKTRKSKLCIYHFCPSGFLHPVTAIYDLSFGETERKQVEERKRLHVRLKLPLDRPMVRAANAFILASTDAASGTYTTRKGTMRLTNVHIGLSSSGLAGGQMSLVEGSYEYYHYLQDGLDDNGWGCAYRSLQTIISWFRLQQYTSVDVPSHRKIQETLVEIGDKEPLFIGSREWIGAIELSFVLDKLLGTISYCLLVGVGKDIKENIKVSCKILNVRSGSELPEKCRELALHFQTQGTPIMIGGGVLAYTLLGVDYNELNGDCAFLILDPHYTGTDDLKTIQVNGWCGWKKAVSSKGKEFFLRDKFYNLLLPQRPNMV